MHAAGTGAAAVNALGPRPVEPDAWMTWLRDALRLAAGRPLPVLALTGAVLLVFQAIHQIEWVGLRLPLTLLAAPLALAAFIRLAWFLDHGRRIRGAALLPGNGDLAVAIGCTAIALAVLAGLFIPAEAAVAGFRELVEQAGLWAPVRGDGIPVPPPLRHTVLGPVLIPGLLFGVAIIATLGLLLAFGQWFLLPMVVLHQPPLAPALMAASAAYPLNPVPMTGVLGVVLLAAALLPLTLGWILPVLLPLAGLFLYTGYRDVFLAELEEEAVRIEAEEESPDADPIR